LPTSNAATRWMIWSRSRVSSSIPASLGSDQQRAVARRSRRATDESDPRAQGNSEGPRRGSQHPAYQRPLATKDIRRRRATTPIFTQERAPPAGRHRRLSGMFAGCVHAGSARHGQLSSWMGVTMVVRSVPGLTLRYGTRVAREQGIGIAFSSQHCQYGHGFSFGRIGRPRPYRRCCVMIFAGSAWWCASSAMGQARLG
jgi:hypothetical protein